MTFTYKFFIKLIFILIVVPLLILSYNLLYNKSVYMNKEYPMWMDVKENMNTSHDKYYDLLCIGDSRAKAAIIPNLLNNFNTLNLSIGGASPIEGYFTLKKYLENNKKPKYILFSYAPYHLQHLSPFWERTVYFDFITYNEYSNVRNTGIKMNYPLGDKSFISYKINPVNYLITYKKSLFVSDNIQNVNDIISNELKLTSGHYFFGRELGSSNLTAETLELGFKANPLVEKYLYKLLQLAVKNDIKIYWYTMPFNNASFNKLKNNFKVEYNEYINNLSKQYPLIVLNKIYSLDNSYFGDESHLFSGSKVLTKKINNLLLETK